MMWLRYQDPQPFGLQYRFTYTRINNGTVVRGFQYLSSFNTWQGSSKTGPDNMIPLIIPERVRDRVPGQPFIWKKNWKKCNVA